jgi:ATP-binding cassette, subfamily A (ABC1), member 3
MISYVVQEKELRQKELMKMMSVTECDIEWSWFFTFMVFNLISASIATLVSCFLFQHSSPYLLWIFWTMTFLSITFLSTALAACASKATRGVLLGLLVSLGGVYLALAIDPRTCNPITVALVGMHPVTTFSYGVKLLGKLEDIGVGVSVQSMQWVLYEADYSFATILLYFVYDCMLWCFLTWYLNRVMTPEYGRALSIWFPFSPSYWRKYRVRDGTKDTESDVVSSDTMSSNSSDDVGTELEGKSIPVEAVSEAQRRQAKDGKSIEIVNLGKSFDNKAVVNGLNLSMFSGQITALLGHNGNCATLENCCFAASFFVGSDMPRLAYNPTAGAGKTTTINMLTGAMAPTSGTATVAGKDIRTQMPEIRRDVGICMQHDCLFPKLTVREHVEFFSRLKGVYSELSWEAAEKHVDQAIEDVALSEKRHTLSSDLSGGMKRKLSVAIAFCGGSKVVLLDEPTSGMVSSSEEMNCRWTFIHQFF